jgi:hypothetical protein
MFLRIQLVQRMPIKCWILEQIHIDFDVEFGYPLENSSICGLYESRLSLRGLIRQILVDNYKHSFHPPP